MPAFVRTVALVVALAASGAAPAHDWQPTESPLMTPWGETLTPQDAWPQYPRPQLVRPHWRNLNGLWDYSVTPDTATTAGPWSGKILVPFAIEAPLSGVGRDLAPDEALWYRREFELEAPPKDRLLLHFEAVDFQTQVWVNGKEAGTHTGGTLAFSFDITPLVGVGANELVVKVIDRTNAEHSYQLVGKQRLNPKGIFYRRCSGIWQTVWLEEVPDDSIRALTITTSMDGTVRIRPEIVGGGSIRSRMLLDGKVVAAGGDTLAVPHPRLWSPAEPVLYDLEIELHDARGNVVDRVTSYTGIREVGRVRDGDGHWRFTLNGEEIFHLGPLDQGWWPDGLLTPPSEEAMLFDLNFLKQSGFNMVRKHVKVEPRRYYHLCDRLGMLVWQDQVSGGPSPKWHWLDPERDKRDKRPEPDAPKDADWPDEAHALWMNGLRGMIDQLGSHPCIVVWTPFNEAWGQHRTMAVGAWTVDYDPSRLVNVASGGNFFPVGHVADMHSYPHPVFPFHVPEYDGFVKVVGEFGGHGWQVPGHVVDERADHHVYGGMPKDMAEFRDRYGESIQLLGELRRQGVAAGVYTQTTDVENEINGLLTYDRKVPKIPADDLREIHEEAGLLDADPSGRTAVRQ